MPWHEKKEVFCKFPLKSVDSVASRHGICESFNYKGSYQSEQNRVFWKVFKTDCLEKEHEISTGRFGRNGRLRSREHACDDQGQNSNCWELVPVSLFRFYGPPARATARILETVEVVAGQVTKRCNKTKPGPIAHDIRFIAPKNPLKTACEKSGFYNRMQTP